MRRKDKERDAAFAWQVLRDAAYSVLAMTDADGTPYCVPVNHIADPEHNAVYFHCAGAGRKWTILEKEPPVCLTAVSRAELVPGELTTAYEGELLNIDAFNQPGVEESKVASYAVLGNEAEKYRAKQEEMAKRPALSDKYIF